MKEIPIITITPVTGTIYKGMTMSGPGFILDVAYTLADGRTFPSTTSCRKKKDVPSALARDQRNATAGAFKATFNEHGEFWGTVSICHIGGSGLEPAHSSTNPQPACHES